MKHILLDKTELTESEWSYVCSKLHIDPSEPDYLDLRVASCEGHKNSEIPSASE